MYDTMRLLADPRDRRNKIIERGNDNVEFLDIIGNILSEDKDEESLRRKMRQRIEQFRDARKRWKD